MIFSLVSFPKQLVFLREAGGSVRRRKWEVGGNWSDREEGKGSGGWGEKWWGHGKVRMEVEGIGGSVKRGGGLEEGEDSWGIEEGGREG